MTKTLRVVLLELVETSPPRFRVIRVDKRLIGNGNLQVGELLTDADVDFLIEVYGDLRVEIRYPNQPT